MERRFQERRKNYYIKKKFQRKFIIKFCSLVVIGSIISGLIIYGMSRNTVTTTFENSRLTIKTTADYILPTVLLSSVIVIILIGIATIFITLFTSHKIAGPLYRMEKDVGEVASGNLKVRFNLRSGDEIKALAVSLDVMAQALKTNIVNIKRILNESESAITSFGSAASVEVKDKLNELKEAIEKFKT